MEKNFNLSLEEKAILHLFLIKGIGPVTIKKIVESKKSLSSIYSFSEKDFIFCGISKNQAKLCFDGLKDLSILEKEFELADSFSKNFKLQSSLGLKITTIVSKDYPELLKNIFAPPPVIYFLGSPDFSNKKNIAFVGSRACNNYAKRCINILAPDLIKAGFTIISGGALGVDSFSHEVSLQSAKENPGSGKTWAVLGSGLLKIYPESNKKLFEKIISFGGSVISTFPLNSPPERGNFPERNRIISGLSLGTVVIQAAEKSGALITANFAVEQGREVFSVPGPIDSLLSVGVNKLISKGATPVLSSKDIIQAFDFKPWNNIDESKKEKPKPKEENKNPDFEKILSELDEPKSLDFLSQALDFKTEKLSSDLFDLELEGLVEQNSSGLWIRI